MKRLPFLAALAWGWLWAAILQYTDLGRWLAKERTWVTVVAGVGVDLALARAVVGRQAWERIVWIIALSSVGIIARSLINEMQGEGEDIAND